MSESETELRAEVERLRRDVDHLLKMLGESGYDGISPKREKLWLDVQWLRVSAEKEGGPYLELDVDATGAGLVFYDGKDRCRATLKTDNFGASLELRNASGKQAVVVNAPDEHGQVGVFSPDGKPRAALKSSKLGGAVNVIQGNGHPGVYLLAEESGGKLEVISAGAKSAVSMFVAEGWVVAQFEKALSC